MWGLKTRILYITMCFRISMLEGSYAPALSIWNSPTVQIDRYGSLRSWIHEASNKRYWNQLVDRLLHPNTPTPERPADWGPLPSWQARRATNGPTPNEDTSESDDETTDDDEEEQPRTPTTCRMYFSSSLVAGGEESRSLAYCTFAPYDGIVCGNGCI